MSGIEKFSGEDEKLKGELEAAAKGDLHHPEAVPGRPLASQKESKVATHYEKVKQLVGFDTLEIFGPTGSGKSKVVLEIARDTKRAGKSVYFLDTERNLSDADIKHLGSSYKYTPDYEEILQITDNLPKVDLVIIDSIGWPILGKFARLNLKQRGEALLKMIAMLASMKEHSYKHNCICIVTNQPISEMMAENVEDRRPFGDKHAFGSKCVLRTKLITASEKKTQGQLLTYRDRNMGKNTRVAIFDIDNEGTRINWSV